MGPVDLALRGFSGELRQVGIREAVGAPVHAGWVLMFDAEDSGDTPELPGFLTDHPDLVAEDYSRDRGGDGARHLGPHHQLGDM